VHSYIKDRQIQIVVSHCQRWVERRIGEWLGPAKPPEETGGMRSLPGNGLGSSINNRHKHEFRLLAENPAAAPLELLPAPTRAWGSFRPTFGLLVVTCGEDTRRQAATY
jgi:hypothetical protein